MFQRTLKRARDLDTLSIITSDDLLEMSPVRCELIRRAATVTWRNCDPRFICDCCEHPVYIKRAPENRLPLWAHRAGAPRKCDWWTGDHPSTLDQIGAAKFAGAQEGKLHFRLKHLIGEHLELDPFTGSGSVVVEKVIVADDGRRKPDVIAIYDKRPIAIELQLATTQLPIIIDREEFYEKQGRSLVWLTWDFEPLPNGDMLSSFMDIYHSHSLCLLSIDGETIARTEMEGSFHVRINWKRDGVWSTRVDKLVDLVWPDRQPPFAKPLVPQGLLEWRETWLNEKRPAARVDMIQPLGIRFRLSNDFLGSERCWEIESAVNCLLSVVVGHPVFSGETHLIQKVNSFLSSPWRYKFADILESALANGQHRHLLASKSVRASFRRAQGEKQLGWETMEIRIVRKLFPEWF